MPSGVRRRHAGNSRSETSPATREQVGFAQRSAYSCAPPVAVGGTPASRSFVYVRILESRSQAIADCRLAVGEGAIAVRRVDRESVAGTRLRDQGGVKLWSARSGLDKNARAQALVDFVRARRAE